MNNKGFMMAEVVIVSSIVLVTLIGLYTSYNKIFLIYNQRIDYYDVTSIYELGNIRDHISIDTKTPSGTEAVYTATGRTVYYVNKNEINTIANNNINQTFKDYVNLLSTSISTDETNILIMERCLNASGTYDDTKCKYAYLEVPNEE